MSYLSSANRWMTEKPINGRLLNHHEENLSQENATPFLLPLLFFRLMKEFISNVNSETPSIVQCTVMGKEEEMVRRKRIPHDPLHDGMASSPKSGVPLRKSTQHDVKHWDFLDEIEAPMWVDLTLECQSRYDDLDDEWFYINHPFHQCSSRQLISAFAHSSGIHVNLEFDVLEQSSPVLPPSVSKSRGKGYTSRDRLQGKQMVTFGNQHTVKNLNKNSTFVSSESTRVAGSKTKKGKNNKLAGSILDSRGENNLTENAGQHNIVTVPHGDQKFTSNSIFSGEGENSSSSTVTSEGSGQQQPNSFEVSSHVSGHAKGFLSALKISLRKSCVTRQASRVEVTNGRLSEGQKSSSGKSSIGSSSSIACDEKILTLRNDRDTTTSDRDVRIPMIVHNKVDGTKLSNAPGVPPAKPKLKSKSFKAPSIDQGNAKVKLVPLSVNRRYTAAVAVKAKEKVVARSSNRIPGGGKGNVAGKAASCQKSSTKSTAQVEKVTARVAEKSTRTTVVSKERISERSKDEKTGKMGEKGYFR